MKKRIFSMLMVLSMLLSIVNVPALAEFEPTEIGKTHLIDGYTAIPTLSLVYMKKIEPAPASGFAYEEVPIEDLSEGDIFYVGVRMDNFKQYKDATTGMFSISPAIIFDTEVLSPEPSFQQSMEIESDQDLYDMGGGVLNDSLQERVNVTGSYFKTGSGNLGYTIGDTVLKDAANPNGVNNAKVIGLTPKYKSNSAAPKWQEDSFITAIYEFKVKKVPDEGGKFIDFSRTSDITLTFDKAGAVKYYYYLNDASNDLSGFTKLDISKVNLFPPTYTVTYDANTANYPDAGYKPGVDEATQAVESVKEGSKATLKNTDKVEISSLLKDVPNKVFAGWYTNADPNPLNWGTKIDPTTDSAKITADTTFYAHYADGYKVTFNLNTDDSTAQFFNGDKDPKSYTPLMDTPLISSTETLNDKIGGGDPTRTGYTFEGWYTKNNGSFVQKYEENDLKTALNKSIDLYARWSNNDDASKPYRITFNKNNGDTDADPTSVGYDTGDTLQKLLGGMPVEPTKANYKFLGWYKNASGDGERLTETTDLLTYTGATADKNTTTVYARWGDVTEPVDPDNPTPDPATAVTVHFEKDSTGNTYAGGTYDYGIVNDKYIKFGDPVGPLPDGDTMHHTDTTKAFDGWYTQQTGGVKVEADQPLMDANLDGYTGLTAGQTVTLYPRWMNKLTVKYNANGLPDTVTIPAQDTENPNANYTIKNITDSTGNYVLKEWVTKPDAITGNIEHYAPGANITLTKSLDLYAVWNYTGPNAVTVVFNANDTAQNEGSLNPNDDTSNNDPAKTKTYTMTRQAGTSISESEMPIATRTNYTFNHWNTNASAAPLDPISQAAIPVVAPATAGDPMNVYAIWDVDTTKTTEITISFDVDGGTPAIPDVKIAINDSLGLKMPADPAKSGNDFGGWYIDTTDESTKKDKDSTFAADTTLKAKWVPNIVIKYDLNGADTPASIADVTASASKVYEDPTTVPTKTGYKFLGWNTKRSGGGVYVEADSTKTYADVADMLETDKTLYAQWAAVPDDKIPDVKDDDPVNPDSDAVHVIFNDNVPAGTKNGITTPTAPKNKYPKWNGTLDDVSMPDNPERSHYIFAGWNTQPDGLGETITGSTVVNNDAANYNGAIQTLAGETDKYEVTLYAQWEINPDEVPEADRRTLTFYNSTPAGKKDAVYKTITVEVGETLGYEVTGPTNDIAEFWAWAEGDVDGNGQITFTKDGGAFKTFNHTAPVTENKEYYAKWTTYVALYLQGYDSDSSSNTVDKLTYTGQAHEPKYDLHYIKYDDTSHSSYHSVGEVIESNINPFDSSSPVTVTYQKDGSTVSEIKDVGTYTIDQDTLAFNSGTTYANADMRLVGSKPASLIVKEAGLTLKVRAGEQADGQKQKKGQNTRTAFEIEGMLNNEAMNDLIDINYYKVKDDTKTEIAGDSDLQLVTETDPTKWDLGKYVIKVTPKANSNYKIGSVVADSNGGAVLFYEREAGDYPAYPSMYAETSTPGTYELTVMGQNIVYELVASDPEIADITLTGNTKYEPNPGDTPVPTTKPLELKDSDYTAAKPIQTSKPDSTNPDPDWDKHYVRVDKYNDSIDFEITAKYPDTTTVTATYGKTGDTATNATVTQDPTTKKWSVNIPTSVKAPDTTTVTVTMASGDETREYTFILQALVEAKIELNYGNSPYGEIMKAANIAEADKAKAKEEFDKANRFATGYIPASFDNMLNSNGETFIFHPETWEHTEEGNMDKDDTAIFVYNGSTFKDPGFVATDAEGKPVNDSQITRTIKVNRMLDAGTDGCVNVSNPDGADAETTKSVLTYVGLDNQMLFTDITCDDRSVNDIRPGVYQMNYHFIDPVTNEDVNVKRNVIVLFRIGDGDMDNEFTPVDTNTVSVAVSIGNCSINGAPDETNALYLYRIMDLDNDGGLTPVDTNEVSVMVSTGVNNYYFYNYLPNN